MKRSLSTLGAPEWNLRTVCTAAAENDYDGIDFRGYLEAVDVTEHPQFTDHANEIRALLDENDLAVSGLSSSIRICVPDDRDENVAAAERYISLARELGVDTVRVFGVGDTEAHSMDELAEIGGETMAAVAELDGADEVRWVVETHDNWTTSADCALLLDRCPESTGLLWDVGHTTRIGGESPTETLDALSDRIEYVHLKDAVYAPDDENARDDGWVFVLPGEGELPVAEAVRELAVRGYDGWFVFEHEKRWQPYVADPEVAYPAFAAWFDAIST